MRFILLLCLGLFSFQISAANLTTQRAEFLQAKQALAAGKDDEFKRLANQLRDYPLYPYLVYADIKERIDEASPDEILNFIQDYSNTPLAAKLRYNWLLSLGEQEKWPLFLSYYKPSDDSELQCYYANALVETQQEEAAFHIIPKLWLTGKSSPAACQPAFAAWQKAGKLTTRLVWQRIALAMKTNNMQLVNYLAQFLPLSNQAKVKLWQQVHINPSLVLQTNTFNINKDHDKQIVMDGINKLSKKNLPLIEQEWPALQQQYSFTEADQQALTLAIAVALARNVDPDAMTWLLKIKPQYTDKAVREWRIRIALLNKNWDDVNKWINQLPPAEKNSSDWRYWQARAYAELGNKQAAQQIYNQLASKIDYYGLLASEQLNKPYTPVVTTYSIDQSLVNNVSKIPAMQRARELYALDFIADARSEWQWAVNKMDDPQLQAAAVLAKQWKWPDRAILTSAKAKLRSDMSLRFPLAYRQEVLFWSKHNNLDPAWVLGIMRQESYFMRDSKSWVGAIGLMQLMPETAKIIIKHMKLSASTENLIEAELNIRLGTAFLKDLLNQFKGNETIATAAYNGGPTRMMRYAKLYPTLGKEIWTEILPFQETRDYVKQVTLGTAIYKRELNK